jgi:hypothetical protein
MLLESYGDRPIKSDSSLVIAYTFSTASIDQVTLTRAIDDALSAAMCIYLTPRTSVTRRQLLLCYESVKQKS